MTKAISEIPEALALPASVQHMGAIGHALLPSRHHDLSIACRSLDAQKVAMDSYGELQDGVLQLLVGCSLAWMRMPDSSKSARQFWGRLRPSDVANDTTTTSHSHSHITAACQNRLSRQIQGLQTTATNLVTRDRPCSE